MPLVNKIFLYIYSSKTSPRKNVYLCIAALHINTAVSFKSNITNIYYCRAPLLDLIYLLLEKNICISDLLTILVCDICYNARKINYFTRKRQFIKSRNFSTSQGKLNSFKDVRGRWHISAYSPKLNIFHQKDIVSRNYTTSRYSVSYKINLFCALYSR